MKTYATKYASDALLSEQLAAAKLKLKNEDPTALAYMIDKMDRKILRKLAAVFGAKVPTPLPIKALADLHLEARYEANGQPLSPPVPKNPWRAAKAFVKFKDKQVNPYPGSPLPRRSPSLTGSSTSSDSSTGKGVQWAEQLVEIRLID